MAAPESSFPVLPVALLALLIWLAAIFLTAGVYQLF
jgi:hypothetical protein